MNLFNIFSLICGATFITRHMKIHLSSLLVKVTSKNVSENVCVLKFSFLFSIQDCGLLSLGLLFPLFLRIRFIMNFLRTAGRKVEHSSIDMETLIEREGGIFLVSGFGIFLI